MSLRYEIGDATRPVGEAAKIIAHICNDVGGWGAGFVLALSQRWPEPAAEYRRWYEGRATNDFALGAVQFVPVTPDITVANMIGQRDITPSASGPPVRYDAIETALATIATRAQQVEASVHMPRIGSGLAGGDWNVIESIVERSLSGIDVIVYDLPS